MSHVSPRHGLPMLCLIAVAVAVIGYQSLAGRAPAPARPTAVATVDLVRAFEQIDARQAADAELLRMADELDTEGKAKKDRITQLEEEIDLYPQGSPRYREAMEKLAMESLSLQAFLEFGRRKLDFEKSRTLGRLYADMKQAATELAERDGYDLVLVDDSVADLAAGTETEMMRQISARRVLFASDQIDITQELIRLMNERFKASAGG